MNKTPMQNQIDDYANGLTDSEEGAKVFEYLKSNKLLGEHLIGDAAELFLTDENEFSDILSLEELEEITLLKNRIIKSGESVQNYSPYEKESTPLAADGDEEEYK